MLSKLFEEGLMFIFLKYFGEKEFVNQIYCQQYYVEIHN